MSGDEKHCITRFDGVRFLLRISQNNQYERKKAEFEMLNTAYENGVSVSKPFEFGVYSETQIYQLTEWCDGKDLEEILPTATDKDACQLGLKAANLLLTLHEILPSHSMMSWKDRFIGKIQDRLSYIENEFSGKYDTSALSCYFTKKLFLLDDCPQCFIHGDYNPGNLILLKNGEVKVVDFNSYNSAYGEPFFELCPILFDDNLSNAFKDSSLNGYFKTGVPNIFYSLMKFYYVYCTLSSLCESDAILDNQYGNDWKLFDKVQELLLEDDVEWTIPK